MTNRTGITGRINYTRPEPAILAHLPEGDIYFYSRLRKSYRDGNFIPEARYHEEATFIMPGCRWATYEELTKFLDRKGIKYEHIGGRA